MGRRRDLLKVGIGGRVRVVEPVAREPPRPQAAPPSHDQERQDGDDREGDGCAHEHEPEAPAERRGRQAGIDFAEHAGHEGAEGEDEEQTGAELRVAGQRVGGRGCPAGLTVHAGGVRVWGLVGREGHQGGGSARGAPRSGGSARRTQTIV